VKGTGGSASGGKLYALGKTVTLVATPYNEWFFDGWYDGALKASTDMRWSFRATAIENGKTYIAQFVQSEPAATYRIYTDVNNRSFGTVEVTPGDRAKREELVTLKARPLPGYAFERWEVRAGSLTISNPNALSVSFVMPEGNVTVKAHFSRVATYTVRVQNSSPTGAGFATTNLTTATAGTEMELTATATNSDFAFSHWKLVAGNILGINNSKDNPLIYTMPASNITVQPIFKNNKDLLHDIKLNVNPTEGRIIINPAVSSAEKGVMITLTAEANPGYTFSHWISTGTAGIPAINSLNSPTVNFPMPAKDIEISAAYSYNFQPFSVPLAQPLGLNSDIAGSSATVSEWAMPSIASAEEAGLIPESLADQDLTIPITRSEFAAICVGLYESKTKRSITLPRTNPFIDTDDQEILKAYSVGITAGTQANEFSPDLLLNREQAATMFARVYKKVSFPRWSLATDDRFDLSYVKPAPFSDDPRISDWAKDSVYFMTANGVINGTGNNMFSPRAITDEEKQQGYASATREQALIMALRMLENL